MHTGGNTGWYKIKSKRKLRDKYSNIVVTHLFLNLVHLIYRAGNTCIINQEHLKCGHHNLSGGEGKEHDDDLCPDNWF